MAFQLKRSEPVGRGIKRCLLHDIDRVLALARGAGDKVLAVHEVRKGMKRLRATLRLAREQLGDDAYRRENYCFRDTARPLTEVRDAEMLGATLDKLAAHFAGEVKRASFAKAQKTLLTNEKAVARRVLIENRALAALARVIEDSRRRIEGTALDDDGWEALRTGLKRVYRAGHRALSDAAATPTVEKLHEWRKQTKYLWHHLELLEPAWILAEKDLADEAHELSQLLGDDHDLAVLRQVVTAAPDTYAPAAAGLVDLIDRRRGQLEEQAFALGRHVYGKTPSMFTGQMKAYWNAWRVTPPPTVEHRPPAPSAGTLAAPGPSRSSDEAAPRKPAGTLPAGSGRGRTLARGGGGA